MQPRQADPEIAQTCYENMLKYQNRALGNYLKDSKNSNITGFERDLMIQTIQFLHANKYGYKQETMHLAGNIADRYLAHCLSTSSKLPNLTQLATIALLIAAKIEQPITPCFDIMLNILPQR